MKCKDCSSMCKLKTYNQVDEEKHWQDVRERAAIAALSGLLSDSEQSGAPIDFARWSIDYADELVKQLKGE